MNRFYFFLWLRWAVRLSLCSLILATIFSLSITAVTYINQGMTTLNSEVIVALQNLFQFWFPISWSLALLIALFRALKYIFNANIAGYELKLYSCDLKNVLDDIGYGDLVKVWRKWFMLMIWLVGSLMILALIYTYVFTSLQSVFSWFSIYWLFAFILISGYFSFMIMSHRCKRVKIVKC